MARLRQVAMARGALPGSAAELDLADARRLLDTLSDNHLIEPIVRERYRFHDLLRSRRDLIRTSVVVWYSQAAFAAQELTAHAEARHPRSAEVVTCKLQMGEDGQWRKASTHGGN